MQVKWTWTTIKNPIYEWIISDIIENSLICTSFIKSKYVRVINYEVWTKEVAHGNESELM